MPTQIGNQQSTHIDFEGVKLTFPLLDQVRAYTQLRREGGANRYVGKCPFHEDSRPSFNVYPSDNRFKCYSCSRYGDVFDFLMAINTSLRTQLDVVDYLMPGGSRIFQTAAREPAPTEHTTEDHEAGGVLLQPKVRVIHPKEVEANARLLRDVTSPRARSTASAREYARSRGWLPERLFGVSPYPVGVGNFQDGVLAEHTVVGFRKRVDEVTAYIFGLAEEFIRYDGQLYVGTKMRLTPEAYRAYLEAKRGEHNDPRLELSPWLAKSGYTNCIPGSVDFNYGASVLVICEGPGDGVRLYHESHRTEQLAEQFGKKVHITFADSASSWTEASMPRRESARGGRPVSFFGGYSSIVLLYDNDEPDKMGRRAGRRAAEVTTALIRQQAPRTPVRDVLLPCKDVCDFFDKAAGTIPGLIDLIKQTRPLR
jgi:CHC2-type zinc finger protein